MAPRASSITITWSLVGKQNLQWFAQSRWRSSGFKTPFLPPQPHSLPLEPPPSRPPPLSSQTEMLRSFLSLIPCSPAQLPTLSEFLPASRSQRRCRFFQAALPEIPKPCEMPLFCVSTALPHHHPPHCMATTELPLTGSLRAPDRETPSVWVTSACVLNTGDNTQSPATCWKLSKTHPPPLPRELLLHQPVAAGSLNFHLAPGLRGVLHRLQDSIFH